MFSLVSTMTALKGIINVAKQQASKTVAVVVPLTPGREFTPDEQISFKHLIHFLGKYNKYMVVPKYMKVCHPGFEIKRFSDKYFGSRRAHIQLLLSPQFYKAFRDYKYILIYHLDSLVFSDQLMEWCKTDIDYIGPPFINCPDSPKVNFERVGNGGFSLRKVESFLKTIYSPRYYLEPSEYWKRYCASKPRFLQYLNFPRKYLRSLRVFNGARWHMSKWGMSGGEDYFWSDIAVKYYLEFKIAPVEMGLRFAFEVAPRLCFERNNFRLPFGCHAWHRYDRKFWEPYLLR